MVENICRNKNVLACGCGYGGFLKYVSEIANSCKGVEFGKRERQHVNDTRIVCAKNIEEYNEKFDILLSGQVQRYSIANHLLWLAKGIPGGHDKWKFIDTMDLNNAYYEKLKELEMRATLFFILKKK